ncbi:MAG: hypothetical protein R3Y06_06720 [Faecalibacterium sp.]
MVAELISKKAAMRKAIALENEKCAKELEQDLRDCLASMAKNEQMFNLEVEEALVEARIYERQALQCRYRYLLEKARAMGLRVRGAY